MRQRQRSRALGSSRGFTQGFTLLEVMVALALLAAALMAMADLAGNALRNHAYARDLSAATLLARGKMAELEQKYQDLGFKDFDEDERGDFAEEGRPDITWQLALVKPDADLSADQLMALLSGMSGGDANDLIAKLMGGAGLAGAAAGAGAPAGGSTSSGPTSASPMAGLMGGFLQSQLTAFGETLKRSLREMRFTVSWRDGRTSHGFTVTTHLLVLNPRAPGGARGDNPEVPANLAVLPSAAQQGAPK
jgi:general secretion pathway protein I